MCGGGLTLFIEDKSGSLSKSDHWQRRWHTRHFHNTGLWKYVRAQTNVMLEDLRWGMFMLSRGTILREVELNHSTPRTSHGRVSRKKPLFYKKEHCYLPTACLVPCGFTRILLEGSSVDQSIAFALHKNLILSVKHYSRIMNVGSVGWVGASTTWPI